MTTSTMTEVDGDLAAARIKCDPHPLTARGVGAMILDAPTVDAIDWGDGTRSDIGGTTARHVYTAAGTYTVSAMHGETVVTTTTVYVRDGLAPVVTFAPNSANPNRIEATFNDDPADMISRYQITWETGVVEEVPAAPKGTVRAHNYRAGTYHPEVRDLHTGRLLVTEVVVTDKEYDPDATVAQGADTMTALLTLTKPDAAGKEITIDWGDGKQTIIPANEALKGKTATHTYTVAKDYGIWVLYSDNSTEGALKSVTIPFPARDGRGIGRP